MYLKRQFLKILSLILLLHAVLPAAAQLVVFTIGDSTVQDYNEGYSPRKGWGQMLQYFFFTAGVKVTNKAVGGTSSKSFYNNQWAAVRNSLKAGNYIFIQFGINDRAADDARNAPAMTTFKEYIRLYVAEARAKGAIPVLVTTVRRNAWTNGIPYDSYHDHPIAMRELATELKTPLVDLDERCKELMIAQGPLYYGRHVTMNLVAGEYPNYTNGIADNVHYQETGATDMARYVCDAIKASTNADMQKLAAQLKPRYNLTVNINDAAKAQTLTRTTSFPEGCPVTLKTIPAANAKFLRWNNAAGIQAGTKSIYQFAMGNTATSYTAIYESDAAAPVGDIAIDNAAKTLNAPLAARYQWYFNNAVISGAAKASLPIASKGTYSVALMDADGAVFKTLSICVTIGADGTIRRIYLIGDSTVATYKDSQYPMAGWGQMLKYFFGSDIQIINHAIGGRSSRSFWEEGRWTPIYEALKPGDYVMIQFGHNDRDASKPERYTSIADYKAYLANYVKQAKEKGAIPVLISPMVMNAWQNGTMRNVFTETGNDYRGAMQQVATEQKAAFVDLNMKSWNFFKTLDAAYCGRFYYHTYPAGEYPNYPEGSNDGTHFQENGAIAMARWVAEGLKEINDPYICPLQSSMKPLYSLTVAAGIANPGSISKSAAFPEGCPVTVKVLPSAGNTLIRWDRGSRPAATATLYQFAMGAANTTLTAIFSNTAPVYRDCAGVAGGKAMRDQCGTCIGGTTGLAACSEMQAEEGTIFDGLAETTNAGFSGTSYVNTDNSADALFRFGIRAEASAVQSISLRYAHSTAEGRPAQLSVNGRVDPATAAFPSTGSFTIWDTVTVKIGLVKGWNIISLKPSSDLGLPNIDKLWHNAPGIAFVPIAQQAVALQEGWNLISTSLHTADSSITGLFAGLDVAEIKTMDTYWRKGQPEALNSLNKLTPGEGYLVRMNAAGKLSLMGMPLALQNPPFKISNGWQLIGWPFQTVLPFSDILNAENAAAVKNLEGSWTPAGISNTIDGFEAGKAYLLQK